MFEDCYLQMGKGKLASCTPLTVSVLASLYALPAQQEAPMRLALEDFDGSLPWSTSFSVAPEQTAAAVSTALRQVVLSNPDLDPDNIDCAALPAGSRARTHLEALVTLWRNHPEVVPADLRQLRDLLACTASIALQPFSLVFRADDSCRSPLERAVLAHLATHHAVLSEDDPNHQRLIGQFLASAAPEESLLGHVQRHLLDPSGTRRPQDSSLAVLSIRDSLSEAEAAAAIVQEWLAQDSSLQSADIAVIIPDTSAYRLNLAEAFAAAGLTLSALPATSERRNVGAEAVLHFLQCRRRPAPAMALASLYCSPVLCWDAATGNDLARCVMKGDFEPYLARDLEGNAARLFTLIRAPQPSGNGKLKDELHRLHQLLSTDPTLGEEVLEAKVQITRLISAIGSSDDQAEPDWDKWIAFAAAYQDVPGKRGAHHLGGVGVMHALEAPRRRYRKLLLLGFNDGRYPAPPAGNPFFLDSEAELVRAATGLELPSQASQVDASLALFARQLGCASEQAVLLMSERDRLGGVLSPSSSLTLIARLAEGAGDPADLVVPHARGQGTIWDSLIAWKARPEFMAAPQPEVPAQYAFDLDLLTLRRKDDGTPRAQSPSRLEKLLVSPLAWLLGELGATHVAWAPEELDAMLRGSLAHEVFERLFVPGSVHPDDAAIEARVPEMLTERIRALAPFLQSSAWAVERMALEYEIVKAARHWSLVLTSLGAEIVDNEFWLAGELHGHPVHGKADCLLRLPGGQPVVVDYKKSSSGARRQRLAKGFDLQVELYRRMEVRLGDERNEGPVQVARVLAAWEDKPAVAYHTLNDGAVLLNGAASVDDAHVEIIEGDIAENAVALVKARFAALRSGRLDTNTLADAKYFQKQAALSTYALEDSPLVAAFMRQIDIPSIELTDTTDD